MPRNCALEGVNLGPHVIEVAAAPQQLAEVERLIKQIEGQVEPSPSGFRLSHQVGADGARGGDLGGGVSSLRPRLLGELR